MPRTKKVDTTRRVVIITGIVVVGVLVVIAGLYGKQLKTTAFNMNAAAKTCLTQAERQSAQASRDYWQSELDKTNAKIKKREDDLGITAIRDDIKETQREIAALTKNVQTINTNLSYCSHNDPRCPYRNAAARQEATDRRDSLNRTLAADQTSLNNLMMQLDAKSRDAALTALRSTQVEQANTLNDFINLLRLPDCPRTTPTPTTTPRLTPTPSPSMTPRPTPSPTVTPRPTTSPTPIR